MNIFQQLLEFFKPLPKIDSWAYRFHMWRHDRYMGKPIEKGPFELKIKGLSYPSELTTIEFPEYPESLNVHPNMHEIELMQEIVGRMTELTEKFQEFGLTIDIVTFQISQFEEAYSNDELEKEKGDDYNSNVPEDWEDINIFDDDPDTLVGFVDSDGNVHDKRDVIPDDFDEHSNSV